MKPKPEKHSPTMARLLAEASRQARAHVAGPFREGARAMREAIATRFGADAIDAIYAQAALDTPIPDLPEPREPKPAPGWQWWAGRDEEWFTAGPFSSREAAVESGAGEFDGDAFHIIEATQGVVTLDAGQLIDAQYFEADDLFDCDHTEPDRIGGTDVVATADAELQALLDEWVTRWRHTFVAPSLFSATRNAERIAATAEPCAACQDPDCDFDCDGAAGAYSVGDLQPQPETTAQEQVS